jgi:hypothetical protein
VSSSGKTSQCRGTRRGRFRRAQTVSSRAHVCATSQKLGILARVCLDLDAGGRRYVWGGKPSVLVRVKAGDHGGEVAVGFLMPARLSRDPLDVFEVDKAPSSNKASRGKAIRDSKKEEKEEKSTADCNAGHLSIHPKGEGGGAKAPPSPGVKHEKVPRNFLDGSPLGNEPHGNTVEFLLCDAEAVCILAALLQYLQKLSLVHYKPHCSDRALHLVVVESPAGVFLQIRRGYKKEHCHQNGFGGIKLKKYTTSTGVSQRSGRSQRG